VITKTHFSRHLNRLHKGEGVRCKFKKCGAAFLTGEKLEEHLKENHLIEGKNPIECEMCKFWYSSKNNILEHWKNHHAAVKSVSCLFCAFSFQRRSTLFHHTKKYHEKEAVRCPFSNCLIFFKSKEQMEEHLENKHKNNCKFCNLTFPSVTKLSSHLRIIHAEKKCKLRFCTFSADSDEELRIHHREKHDKAYDCVYCGKVFMNKQYRNNHVKIVCSKLKGLIKCNFFHCAIYFKDAAELEKHKKEAHKNTKMCPICQKTFSYGTSCSAHIRQFHPEALRCKYQLCVSFFKSQAELEKHDQEEHGERFVCAFCNYASSDKLKLKDHIENRHLPRDKRCPRCPKLFGSKKHFDQHVYNCKA